MQQGPWTEEEDNRLKTHIEECGLSWALIAQKLENRSADRWCTLASCLVRKLTFEGYRVFEALASLPRSGSGATGVDGGRGELIQSLDSLSLKHFTERDQNHRLMAAVATHGTSWKDIQLIHFSMRSANNVKNQ